MYKNLLFLIFLLTNTGAQAQYRFTCFDLNPGGDNSTPSSLISFNGRLYFEAVDKTAGLVLWQSDGTPAGTAIFKNIGAPSPSISKFRNPIVFAGKLFFKSVDTLGTEMWCTDGTSQGTEVFKDIYPGANSSGPDGFTICGNKMFFAAADSLHGTELWITDGTVAGTQLVLDINPGTANGSPSEMFVFGNKICFYANDGVHGGEPWISDGTASGTMMLKDILPTGSSSPKFFDTLNGMLLFYANYQLWATDGTPTGTQMIKDTYPGNIGINSNSCCVYNGRLYFSAQTLSQGHELWSTDGTTTGTQQVKDINTGTGSSTPTGFFRFKNKFYFSAYTATEGRELWVSDGTAGGTQMIKDIYTGTSSSSPDYFIEYNNRLVFRAMTDLAIGRLYSSDGTAAGTREIVNTDPKAFGGPVGPMSGFHGCCMYDSSLYLCAIWTFGYTGQELWKIEDSALSVPPLSNVATFAIYPNPGKGLFTVRLGNGYHDKAELTLYDIAGRKQYEQALPAQLCTIDLSWLPRGLYQAVVKSGEAVSVKKLVLE